MAPRHVGLIIGLFTQCYAENTSDLTPKCTVKTNTDVAVRSYKQTSGVTVGECCAACTSDPQCKVAVHIDDECHMKDQVRLVDSTSRFVTVFPGTSPSPVTPTPEPSPAPTPAPTPPPTPAPPSECTVKMNTDVAVRSYLQAATKTVGECCALCTADYQCKVAVFVDESCHLKDEVRLVDSTSDFVTVFPGKRPTTTPSPPSPYQSRTPRGCGVAIAGDWPRCGRKFSTEYDFDLTAMMKNAQDVAHYPLWRYDWRATQHPVSGPWTYVSMDWCWKENERPSPAYSDSPGLMSWNEPNVPGQCNSGADDPRGIQEFVDLAREYKRVGKFVVSPAPGDGTGWLDTFFERVKAKGFVGIDYIAYHHYVSCNPDTSGDGMYWEMQSMLTRHINLMYKWNKLGFSIKGVWITEIACAPSGGWGNRPYHWEDDKPALLMNKFIDIQNNNRELQAWNWFGYGGFGQLWDHHSSELTDLGHTYFSNCHGNREPVDFGVQQNATGVIANAASEVSNRVQTIVV